MPSWLGDADATPHSRSRRAAASRLSSLRAGRPSGSGATAAASRESAEPSGAAAQGYDPSAVPERSAVEDPPAAAAALSPESLAEVRCQRPVTRTP